MQPFCFILNSIQFEDATKEALFEIIQGKPNEGDDAIPDIQLIIKSQSNTTNIRELKVSKAVVAPPPLSSVVPPSLSSVVPPPLSKFSTTPSKLSSTSQGWGNCNL